MGSFIHSAIISFSGPNKQPLTEQDIYERAANQSIIRHICNENNPQCQNRASTFYMLSCRNSNKNCFEDCIDTVQCLDECYNENINLRQNLVNLKNEYGTEGTDNRVIMDKKLSGDTVVIDPLRIGSRPRPSSGYSG